MDEKDINLDIRTSLNEQFCEAIENKNWQEAERVIRLVNNYQFDVLASEMTDTLAECREMELELD